MVSTIFGRSVDFENAELNRSEKLVVIPASVALFDPTDAGPPQQEPIFGTHYWCQDLSAERLQEWSDLAKPIMPPRDSKLALPHKNPFIPSRFSLKLLPPADCDHPLLNCSLKLQITVGKTKVKHVELMICFVSLYYSRSLLITAFPITSAMVPSYRHPIQ
jgi:secreted Zn-dependent insulinase-like peptidase